MASRIPALSVLNEPQRRVRTHVGHEHGGAEASGLQRADDLRRDVGVVSDGRRDVYPGRTSVGHSAASVHPAPALQDTPRMLPVRILKHTHTHTHKHTHQEPSEHTLTGQNSRDGISMLKCDPGPQNQS